MAFKVIWTEPAVADLEAITAYIARFNPEAARRVGDDILEHVETLATFPYIGPRYPRGSVNSTREIVCWNYRIFYRVREQEQIVEVLTVWHGARREPNLPE